MKYMVCRLYLNKAVTEKEERENERTFRGQWKDQFSWSLLYKDRETEAGEKCGVRVCLVSKWKILRAFVF